MKKSLKILNIISMIIAVFFVGWMILSIVDISLHNIPGTDGYLQYASWNLVKLIFSRA